MSVQQPRQNPAILTWGGEKGIISVCRGAPFTNWCDYGSSFWVPAIMEQFRLRIRQGGGDHWAMA